MKHDLVRLEDKYGRKAKPYEGKSSEKEKKLESAYFLKTLLIIKKILIYFQTVRFLLKVLPIVKPF